MSDRLRLVTRAADGTPTTIRDYENGTTFVKARDSFGIASPAARPVQSADVRRYGGSRTVGETHENGSIKWRSLVAGDSGDAVVENVEAMLAELQTGAGGLFVEWRPDGTTESAFYEVRGPGSYVVNYQWSEFAGARVLPVDIQVPIAPLARGAVSETAVTSRVLPTVLEIDDVAGRAGALADVEMSFDALSGDGSVRWALAAWWPRQRTPTSGYAAPLGIHEAESIPLISSSWGASTSGAGFSGGSGARCASFGAEFVAAGVLIDMAAADPDPFASTLDVEVFARVQIASGVDEPFLYASAAPMGSSILPTQVAADVPAGRFLREASSGSHFRLARLGVFTLPAGAAAGLWAIRVEGATGSDSDGAFDLDYVMVVPARSRCMSQTGRSYLSVRSFAPANGAAVATIRSDLTTTISEDGGTAHPSGGLGGAPIVLPNGDADLLLAVSNMTPDAPDYPDASELALYEMDITVTTTDLHRVAVG